MNFLPRVLVIDDELRICESIKALLQGHNYQVDFITCPTEIEDALGAKSYDLFLLDLCMPEISGFDVLEKILAEDPEAFVIMITGKLGSFSLICDNVSKPDRPGIFSSKKIMSKVSSPIICTASAPLVHGVTL